MIVWWQATTIIITITTLRIVAVDILIHRLDGLHCVLDLLQQWGHDVLLLCQGY